MEPSNILAGCIGLVIGCGTMVNWWFVMFSDSWYGEFQRGLSKAWFDLGRNTESLITPAAGIMMLSGGYFLFLLEGGGDRRSWTVVCVGGVCLSSMVLAMLGLVPFRLPGPMYPEWQLERRRRRAQEAARANWEHETGSIVTRGRHAAPPETAADAGGQYGQYAGDADGEGLLRSGDSLLVRAHLTHPDDNTGAPQWCGGLVWGLFGCVLGMVVSCWGG